MNFKNSTKGGQNHVALCKTGDYNLLPIPTFFPKNSVKRSKKTVITSFTGTICLENQENSFIEDIFRNFAHGKGMVCNLTA